MIAIVYKKEKEEETRLYSQSLENMSIGENINRNLSLTSARHFLIVPTFNPERRHSWGNVITPVSTRTSNLTSSKTIINADIIR